MVFRFGAAKRGSVREEEVHEIFGEDVSGRRASAPARFITTSSSTPIGTT
jgi:hypothetical protein